MKSYASPNATTALLTTRAHIHTLHVLCMRNGTEICTDLMLRPMVVGTKAGTQGRRVRDDDEATLEEPDVVGRVVFRSEEERRRIGAAAIEAATPAAETALGVRRRRRGRRRKQGNDGVGERPRSVPEHPPQYCRSPPFLLPHYLLLFFFLEKVTES